MSSERTEDFETGFTLKQPENESELEAYGVWIKTGPTDITEEAADDAIPVEQLPDFDFSDTPDGTDTISAGYPDLSDDIPETETAAQAEGGAEDVSDIEIIEDITGAPSEKTGTDGIFPDFPDEETDSDGDIFVDILTGEDSAEDIPDDMLTVEDFEEEPAVSSFSGGDIDYDIPFETDGDVDAAGKADTAGDGGYEAEDAAENIDDIFLDIDFPEAEAAVSAADRTETDSFTEPDADIIAPDTENSPAGNTSGYAPEENNAGKDENTGSVSFEENTEDITGEFIPAFAEDSPEPAFPAENGDEADASERAAGTASSGEQGGGAGPVPVHVNISAETDTEGNTETDEMADIDISAFDTGDTDPAFSGEAERQTPAEQTGGGFESLDLDDFMNDFGPDPFPAQEESALNENEEPLDIDLEFDDSFENETKQSSSALDDGFSISDIVQIDDIPDMQERGSEPEQSFSDATEFDDLLENLNSEPVREMPHTETPVTDYDLKVTEEDDTVEMKKEPVQPESEDEDISVPLIDTPDFEDIPAYETDVSELEMSEETAPGETETPEPAGEAFPDIEDEIAEQTETARQATDGGYGVPVEEYGAPSKKERKEIRNKQTAADDSGEMEFVDENDITFTEIDSELDIENKSGYNDEEENRQKPPVSVVPEEPHDMNFDDISAFEDDLRDSPAERAADEKDGQHSLLAQIASELASIRSEISTLKTELDGLKKQDVSPALPQEKDTEPSGFFADDGGDETIALTGDELNNILINADFTEESGDTETEERSAGEGIPENGSEPEADEHIPEETAADEAPVSLTEPENAQYGSAAQDTAGPALSDFDEPQDFEAERQPGTGAGSVPEEEEFPDFGTADEQAEPISKESAESGSGEYNIDDYQDTGGFDISLDFNENLEEPSLDDLQFSEPESEAEPEETLPEEISIPKTEDILVESDEDFLDSSEYPLTAAIDEKNIEYLKEDANSDIPEELPEDIPDMPFPEPEMEEIVLEDESALDESSVPETAELTDTLGEEPGAEEEITASFETELPAEDISAPEDAGADEEFVLPPEEETFTEEVEDMTVPEPEFTVKDADAVSAAAEEQSAVFPEPAAEETEVTEPEAQEPAAVPVKEPEAQEPAGDAGSAGKQQEPENGGKEDLSSGLREEIKTVLCYMDQLLESLPEEKIEEFAKSEHFETYKKLFQELGLT